MAFRISPCVRVTQKITNGQRVVRKINNSSSSLPIKTDIFFYTSLCDFTASPHQRALGTGGGCEMGVAVGVVRGRRNEE